VKSGDSILSVEEAFRKKEKKTKTFSSSKTARISMGAAPQARENATMRRQENGSRAHISNKRVRHLRNKRVLHLQNWLLSLPRVFISVTLTWFIVNVLVFSSVASNTGSGLLVPRHEYVNLVEQNSISPHVKPIKQRTIFAHPPFTGLSFYIHKKHDPNLLIEAFSVGDVMEVARYHDAVFIFQQRKRFHFDHLKPWQRPCHVPGESQIASKPKFQKQMKHYARSNRNKKLPFIIEAYALDDDADRLDFLTRLRHGGGMDVPWVLKDNKMGGRARGVSTLGPNSKELYDLRIRLLENNATFSHGLTVQRYVQNVLTYNGRKFHIRAFLLVTSVDPLIVHFHRGYLTISPIVYNETDFSKKMLIDDVDHPMFASNLTKEEHDALGDASFSDFVETQLKPHVVQNQHLHHISDPEAHVVNQMKVALAQVFVAFRQYFDLGRPYKHNLIKFPTENAFGILGVDFIVDRDLHVSLIEINTNPHLTRESAIELAVFDITLPEMVEMITEVYDKQMNNETVLPLKSERAWELIYTDDFQFTYDFSTANETSFNLRGFADNLPRNNQSAEHDLFEDRDVFAIRPRFLRLV
jgi:hypothetical protein